MAGLCERPFSGYLVFTTISNGLPFAFMISSAVTYLDGAPHSEPLADCTTEHQLGLWLLVQCAVQVCNVAMACYLFARFGRPYDRSKPHDRNFARRFAHLACEDPVMAVYILVAIFMIVWQIIGGVWLGHGSDQSECAPESLRTLCRVATVCMWIFIGMGAFIIFIAYVDNSCQEDRSCCGVRAPDNAIVTHVIGSLFAEQNQQRRQGSRGRQQQGGAGTGWGISFSRPNFSMNIGPRQQQQQQQQQLHQQQQAEAQALSEATARSLQDHNMHIPVAQPVVMLAEPVAPSAPPPPPASQQQQDVEEQQQRSGQQRDDLAATAARAGGIAGRIAVAGAKAGGRLALKGAKAGLEGAKALAASRSNNSRNV